MQEKVGILPGFSFSHYIIYIATGGLIFPRSTGSPFPDPVSPRPARPFERPRPIHRPMQITSRECSPKLPSRRRHDGCGASRPSPSRLKKRGGARTFPRPPRRRRVGRPHPPGRGRRNAPSAPHQPSAFRKSASLIRNGRSPRSDPSSRRPWACPQRAKEPVPRDTIPEKNQRSSFMPPSSGLPFDADPLQGVLGPDRMADQILDVSLLKERFLFVI